MSEQNSAVNTFVGFLSVFVAHAIAIALMYFCAYILDSFSISTDTLFVIFGIAVLFIGLSQLLYVVPLGLWLRSRGRGDTAKGVAIGALITALLNGGCFVVVYFTLVSWG